MKTIFLSILILTISLKASEEFPLINPYAVEEAPIVIVQEVVEPEAIEEEVVTEGTNSVEEIKDSDNDGIIDEEDKCPDTQDKIVVDETGCEIDDDNDGVVNSKDNCPDTSKEFMVDGYGCPQTMVLNIKFESSKATINNENLEGLKSFAQFLKDNPGYQVLIYGHTDSSGSKESNKTLSQDRANAVRDSLVQYDIDKFRFTAIGKGGSEPIADNETPEGRAQNRRIEIELIE